MRHGCAEREEEIQGVLGPLASRDRHLSKIIEWRANSGRWYRRWGQQIKRWQETILSSLPMLTTRKKSREASQRRQHSRWPMKSGDEAEKGSCSLSGSRGNKGRQEGTEVSKNIRRRSQCGQQRGRVQHSARTLGRGQHRCPIQGPIRHRKEEATRRVGPADSPVPAGVTPKHQTTQSSSQAGARDPWAEPSRSFSSSPSLHGLMPLAHDSQESRTVWKRWQTCQTPDPLPDPLPSPWRSITFNATISKEKKEKLRGKKRRTDLHASLCFQLIIRNSLRTRESSAVKWGYSIIYEVSSTSKKSEEPFSCRLPLSIPRENTCKKLNQELTQGCRGGGAGMCVHLSVPQPTDHGNLSKGCNIFPKLP